MPRFFVPGENIEKDTVRILGEDARHIARSLRMAVGESVTVCDPGGNVYTCVLESITDEAVTAHLGARVAENGEGPLSVTLYQALPKGDKMDLIVQKAVEFGASAVVPFLSERCISRPDEKSLEKKTARWQRIALEAAKQCGRGRIPTVGETVGYRQMLEAAKSADIACFCYEGEGTASLRDVLRAAKSGASSLSVVIGAEGGFSNTEAAAARDAGLTLCGLGSRILRCESASGFALSCITYEFEL